MKIFLLCFLLLFASVCHAQTPSALDSSLFAAVEAQDVKSVQSLLENGSNANARDKNGMSPLLHGVQEARNEREQAKANRVTITRLLLEHGADPNMRFPLMAARTNAPVLKLLLEAGADVNKRDENGSTVLMWLCLYRLLTPEILQLLLEHNADPNVRDNYGDTALMEAIAAGVPGDNTNWNQEFSFAQLTDQLLASGARLEIADNRGHTVLMEVARRQQIGDARVLLKRGSNSNARDKQGQTALMHGCQVLVQGEFPYGKRPVYNWPSTEMVRLLLESGADVNACDKVGQSAFIWLVKSNPNDFTNLHDKGLDLPAIAQKRKEQIIAIARQLIENGADVLLVTDNGNTALKWAKLRGNKNLVALLESAGAK